jgi:glycosyltransferase involved in cell wall biosynthesis
MNLAKCLVFVSYYEGFGLPILEAQSVGCPVITSKISATSEIAGKGAILVDPENIMEIAQSIENLFTNIEIKKNLISEGFSNAQKFTWEKTATQTVKIYEKILNRQS